MIVERIKKDSLQARKEKNELKSNLLTSVYSQAKTAAINEGRREPNDQDLIQAIKKFLKSIEENIQLGKENQISKENYEQALKEKEILMEYLPKQLSENELREIIKNSGAKNIGEAMKYLKEHYPDQYDGKTASQIAKEILG
ncbi:MAG: GatB/YqeY domain-containing protein [Leptospiraceae bacterium]|nr:GatB/YqeY domain-containing protein [Leptospiraceae bacterium]MDW7976575.1 GatB/YqeY domain-containing protein [Leptospiraceae bacterium]